MAAAQVELGCTDLLRHLLAVDWLVGKQTPDLTWTTHVPVGGDKSTHPICGGTT